MNQIKSTRQFAIKAQAGFSIVELMVAGVLGLLLIGGVIQLFLSSNRNFTMQDDLAALQEDGRFALMFIERNIQRAGWIANISETSPPLPVDIDQSSDGSNDQVTVSYTATINGVDNIDCTGTVVANGRISNTFYVSGDDLMCRGNGGGQPQPFAKGIEMFQVLYGVEPERGCPDGVVNYYLNRNDVVSDGLADRIVSIRIGMLMKGEDNVLPKPESKSFTVLNVSYNSPSDQVVRRLFQQTIFMPNAAYRAVGNAEQILKCMASSV